MEVLIRKGTKEDYKGKGYVHYQSWIETYSDIFPKEVMDNISLEQRQQLAYDHPENTFVAIIDNNIIGFSCYTKSRDDDLEDTGELMAIYILKEYHGLGIAPKLLKPALKQLSKYKQVCLWVLRDNHRAIRFYEKNGFVKDGTTKPYRNTIAVRMIRRNI